MNFFLTFDLTSKVLAFENKNKKMFFCFVFCSLNRTFADCNRLFYE